MNKTFSFQACCNCKYVSTKNTRKIGFRVRRKITYRIIPINRYVKYAKYKCIPKLSQFRVTQHQEQTKKYIYTNKSAKDG